MSYEDQDDGELDESYGLGTLEAIPLEFPKDIGECINELYRLRAQRKMLDNEVKARKRVERAYELHIISTLQEQKLQNGGGSVAAASITPKKVPTPKSWPEIWDFVFENKATDLLQRRLAPLAVAERWEQGIIVPGVESFDIFKLSLTKRK